MKWQAVKWQADSVIFKSVWGPSAQTFAYHCRLCDATSWLGCLSTSLLQQITHMFWLFKYPRCWIFNCDYTQFRIQTHFIMLLLIYDFIYLFFFFKCETLGELHFLDLCFINKAEFQQSGISFSLIYTLDSIPFTFLNIFYKTQVVHWTRKSFQLKETELFCPDSRTKWDLFLSILLDYSVLYAELMGNGGGCHSHWMSLGCVLHKESFSFTFWICPEQFSG